MTATAYTRAFWAKSDRENPQRIHLLEHHMADVGVCFEALLAQPTIGQGLARAGGGSPAHAGIDRGGAWVFQRTGRARKVPPFWRVSSRIRMGKRSLVWGETKPTAWTLARRCPFAALVLSRARTSMTGS